MAGVARAVISSGLTRCAAASPVRSALLGAGLTLTGGLASAAQESSAGELSELPTPAELRELVAPAESVAVSPHRVKLESFRADTINGVYLVDSDLPSARHVAYGKDSQGFRYVWFSRRNPLRSNLVALYEVDGTGPPDVLYWRQVNHGEKVERSREFKAPAAADVNFDYTAGTPCGKPACGEGWREFPLERIAVPESFFKPMEGLFRAAARHGEEHLDHPVSSLGDASE